MQKRLSNAMLPAATVHMLNNAQCPNARLLARSRAERRFFHMMDNVVQYLHPSHSGVHMGSDVMLVPVNVVFFLLFFVSLTLLLRNRGHMSCRKI